MTKNVLIITQSFPPLGNMAARRFGFLVPYMQSCGWQPWVLTTRAEGPLAVTIPNARVIRLGQHPQTTNNRASVARHDLARISDAPRRGLSPLLEGARQVAAATGPRLRAVDYTYFTWCRQILRRQASLRAALPRIDLVLGSFGPAAALWLARNLARRLRARWVADFRDLAALRPDGRAWLSRRIDGRIERHLLRTAAGITAVSPTLAAILSETYRLPTEVVYNGWDDATHGAGTESHGAEPSREPATMPAGPYLYYAGRWYPEREPAARLVLELLARRGELHWVIRSLGPAAAEHRIRTEAASLGLSERVHLRPPTDPAQVRREADRALANLVLDNVDCRQRWSRGTLTGKFLELVAARPAVLAVTRADSDMGPILRQTSKGAICPDVESLDRFVGRLQDGSSSYSGNRPAIRAFSKSRQAAVLCDFLDRLVVTGRESALPRSSRKAS